MKNVILTHLVDETEEEENQSVCLLDLEAMSSIFYSFRHPSEAIVIKKISTKSLLKEKTDSIKLPFNSFSLITVSLVSLKKEKKAKAGRVTKTFISCERWY